VPTGAQKVLEAGVRREVYDELAARRSRREGEGVGSAPLSRWWGDPWEGGVDREEKYLGAYTGFFTARHA